MRPPFRLLPLILTLLVSACEREAEPERSADRGAATGPAPQAEAPRPRLPADPDTLVELEWDDLTPAGWQPEPPTATDDIEHLDDDDPRARELMAKLKALWAEAPMIDALDGRRVTLSGFVLPLTNNATELQEFLLVPYFGACIHVPPPPANQAVHVVMPDGAAYYGGLFDNVWVQGRLRVKPFRHELGDAGYRIDGAIVSLYEHE